MTVSAEETKLRAYLSRDEALAACSGKQELYQVPCGETTYWVPARNSFQAVQAVTKHLGITPIKNARNSLLPDRFSIRPDPACAPEGRTGHYYLLEDSQSKKSYRFLRPHAATVRELLLLFFGVENEQKDLVG